MPTEVVMPKLGLNMEEGLLFEWLKKEGDKVQRGEALFVVETDKLTTESPAQVDGILSKILVEAGSTVPVRTVVALIITENEQDSAAAAPHGPKNSSVTAPENTSQAASAPTQAAAVAAPARPGHLIASPLAKKLAQEHQIDLANVQGSGPNGRISQEDVERYLQAAQTPQAPAAAVAAPTTPIADTIPMEGVRAVIAERMTQSLQSAAQLTLHTEVDASGMVAYREQLKKEAEKSKTPTPSYNSILISAVAKALREHPRLNARQVDKSIQLLKEIHIGLAVDTESGLMVVVVRDADRKSISEIHAELGALTERALTRRSLPDDLSGSTFTITNLGGLGIDFFTPIINPPEAAILGVGRIIEKLTIQNGKIAQNPMLSLSLTFDHRLVDGAPAARFLLTVGEMMNRLA